MIFRGFRELTITVVTRQNLNISRKTGPDARYPEQSLKSRSRRADPRVFRTPPRTSRQIGAPRPQACRDAFTWGYRPRCVSAGGACGSLDHRSGLRAHPVCHGMQTEQISTGSGGSGPCPAVCACPGIRGSMYCPPDGSRRPRPPCGVCRGIRKPALRLPDRPGSIPTGA